MFSLVELPELRLGGILPLQVRAGSANSALLFKECHDPGASRILSPGRWLWLRFYSDNEVSNTGFEATWNIIGGLRRGRHACETLEF